MDSTLKKTFIYAIPTFLLWLGAIFSFITFISVKLENLATYSGIVSSNRIKVLKGKSTVYLVELGLNNDSQQFDVRSFGERFYAEYFAQDIKLGDTITIHYIGGRVYQLENTKEILYVLEDAKKEDRNLAIALACMAAFFTIYIVFMYLNLKKYHAAHGTYENF